jgi:hypothetical protein
MTRIMALFLLVGALAASAAQFCCPGGCCGSGCC